MTLKELEIGQRAIVKAVNGEGALRGHLLDMGVIPETELVIIKFAPMGDPVEVRIYDYELTLRLSEAEQIEVEPLPLPAMQAAEGKEAGAGMQDAKGKEARAKKQKEQTPKSVDAGTKPCGRNERKAAKREVI